MIQSNWGRRPSCRSYAFHAVPAGISGLPGTAVGGLQQGCSTSQMRFCFSHPQWRGRREIGPCTAFLCLKKKQKNRDFRSAFQQLLRPWSGEILERQHHNPGRTSSQQLFWLAANFCRLSKLKWEGWIHTDSIELQLHLFSKSNNAWKCISNHCCGRDWLSSNGSAESWKSNKVIVSKTPTLWADLWMSFMLVCHQQLTGQVNNLEALGLGCSSGEPVSGSGQMPKRLMLLPSPQVVAYGPV